jgi:thiol-disulfide isomerase/thioredoxin
VKERGGVQSQPGPKELPLNDQGLSAGTSFPQHAMLSVQGTPVIWTSTPGAGTIVLFTSYACTSCKETYPLINPFLNKNPGVHIIVVVEGTEEDARSVQAGYSLSVPIVVLTQQLRDEVQLRAFPFGYLLSDDGKVVAKGIVSHQWAFDFLLQFRGKLAAAG